MSECFHAEDGHPCGRDSQHICLQEQCVESACGDDFIDVAVGEECEGEGPDGALCIGCELCAGDACEQDSPSPCPPGQAVSGEVCNSIDDDCDGTVDEGVTIAVYQDADADGYGNPTEESSVCTGSAGYAAQTGDCDDNNPARRPGATEVCDALDNDCDATVDEGLTTTCWADADGDGFAAPDATQTVVCGSCGVGSTAQEPVGTAIDCNDANGSVKPGGVELCNGVDDDCEGGVDEGACP